MASKDSVLLSHFLLISLSKKGWQKTPRTKSIKTTQHRSLCSAKDRLQVLKRARWWQTNPDVFEQSFGENPDRLVDDPVQGGMGSLSRVFAALWVALPAALHQRSTGGGGWGENPSDYLPESFPDGIVEAARTMIVPEKRATVDQGYGPGNIPFPSVSEFSLGVVEHLRLPLKTGHAEAS